MILQSSFDRIVQTQWGWLQRREEVCRDHIWKNRSSPRGPDPSLPSTEATWTAGWEARSMSVLTGQWGREEGCCPWGLWDTTQQWVPAGERAWRGLRRAQESCALVSPHMARRSSLAGGTFPRVFLVGGTELPHNRFLPCLSRNFGSDETEQFTLQTNVQLQLCEKEKHTVP